MEHRDQERLRLKAELFKALGHPLRLGIVEFLKNDERCVCEIVDHVGTGMPNVSKHLSVLRKCGIISDRRDGLKMMYRLTMPCVLDFAGCAENHVIGRLEEQRSVMIG